MYDPEALRCALPQHPKYIGMIGCANKNERVVSLAKAEELPESYFKDIHAPIGLPIGAKGPFEIAISIVAELIRVYRKAS